MHPFVRLVAVVLSGLVLASCNTPPSRGPFAQITFANFPPIRVDVAAVDIVEAYQSPLADPHVEHLFPQSPAQMARRWAQDRLQPAGNNGRLVYVITDARVIETELPKRGGLSGAFTHELGQRYDAMLTVQLDIQNAGGLRKGSISVTVRRSETVVEDATLNEREAIWFGMVDQMSRDLNAELDRRIRTEWGAFLR